MDPSHIKAEFEIPLSRVLADRLFIMSQRVIPAPFCFQTPPLLKDLRETTFGLRRYGCRRFAVRHGSRFKPRRYGRIHWPKFVQAERRLARNFQRLSHHLGKGGAERGEYQEQAQN